MIGICNLSIIPCRKEPSDKSEMVTQLLLGEHFEILEAPEKIVAEKKSWVLIRIAYDGCECWIDKKQFIPLSETNIRQITESNTALSAELVQLATGENGERIPVILGSSLPKFKYKTFYLGKQKFSFDGTVIFPFAGKKGELYSIVEIAKWYINTPYLWGGRSPFGIDCSGLTQIVFKICGIKLLRDAWQQAQQGETLSFLEEAQPGDLAFFDNETGKIVHAGILLDDKKIIHSHGKVRIDKLDHHGIFNEETKKYTHRLRIIKKFR